MAWEGVPRLTTIDGQDVMVYADGTAVPVQDTAAPQFTGGQTDATQTGRDGGTGTGGEPWFVQAGTPGTASSDGNGGSSGSYGRRYGGYSGGSDDDERRYGSSGGEFGYDWGDGIERPVPPPSSTLASPGWLGDSGADQTKRQQPVVPEYFGAQHHDWGVDGASGGTGHSGGLPSAAARLRSARSRIAAALGSGGSSQGGYSSGSTSGGTSSGHVAQPKMHGEYAHGLDPTQAMGLTSHPTAMLPRVFHGLDPSNPLYTRLGDIPAGAMALLTGKGTPSSIANKVGKIYEGAGTTGDLPSTSKLIHGLTTGKGIEDMFMGIKAGKGDYPSAYAPGYVAGHEPMSMTEAAGTLGPLLDAALYGENLQVQMKYGSAPGSWGNYLIDKAASRMLGKKAGRGAPIYRSVGRRLFRSG